MQTSKDTSPHMKTPFHGRAVGCLPCSVHLAGTLTQPPAWQAGLPVIILFDFVYGVSPMGRFKNISG